MLGNVEDEFKKLDEKEFHFVARQLGALRRALQKQKFSDPESFLLVQDFAKLLYHMSIENFFLSQDDNDDDDDDEDLEEATEQE